MTGPRDTGSAAEAKGLARLSLDAQGLVVALNGEAERLLGLATADAIGQPIASLGLLTHAELAEAAQRGLVELERAVPLPDQTRIRIRLSLVARLEGGASPGFEVTALPLDGRRNDPADVDALKRLVARYRAAIDSVDDAVFLHEIDGRIVDVNARACESLGKPRAELVGARPYDFDPTATQTQMAHIRQSILSTGEVRFVGVHRHKSGRDFPVDVHIRLHSVDGDEFGVSIARDATERMHAQDALGRAEEHNRRALRLARVIAWSYHIESDTIQFFNDSDELFDIPRGPHRAGEIARRIPPEDLEQINRVKAAFSTGEPFEVEHRMIVGAETRWLLVRGQPERDADGQVVRITGYSQDVTAQKKLEEQLRQAQKLEAIARLAGGIAHDFNNLLTVMKGYVDVMALDEGLSPSQRSDLDAVAKAAQRGSELTRQLLTFSRKQIARVESVDLNDVVRESTTLLRRLVGEDVTVTTDLTPSPTPVKADRGQLHQVLMNLIVNARDAMPTGGEVSIRTALVTHGEGALGPAGTILLEVADTGTGMSEAVKRRVFEPFFTTKAVGHGTGLGLSTVYGIVQGAGGHIAFDSKVGRGTTFSIRLPAQSTSTRPAAEQRQPNPGVETVLVVEDEPQLLRLVTRILSANGYKVLAAASPGEALALAGSDQAIELLLTDVVMPEQAGPALAGEIKAQRAGIKVLFMSGYTDDAVLRQGVEAERHQFLQKPFSASELLMSVRSTLDGKH